MSEKELERIMQEEVDENKVAKAVIEYLKGAVIKPVFRRFN